MPSVFRFLVLLPVLACSSTADESSGGAPDATLLSNGSSSVIEIVADGSFDPNTTPEDLPRAQMTAIPGRWQTDYVVRDVLGWSDEEIAADQQAAADWFMAEYGFDPNQLASEGRLVYEDTVLDSRAGFRVAMATDFAVPEGGIPAYNLSKIAMSVDPEGIALGGARGSGMLMEGQAIQYGAYVFESELGLHRIAYWTLRPVIDNQGAAVWTCELDSPDFGTGIAQGLAILTLDDAGVVEADIRNHVVFW